MQDLNAQRNYKDRIFCRVFREKTELLALYNAMNGSNYTNPRIVLFCQIIQKIHTG